MLGVMVRGGTGAGRRIVKQPKPWLHSGRGPTGDVCVHRLLPGDRYSCPDCGARRPA